MRLTHALSRVVGAGLIAGALGVIPVAVAEAANWRSPMPPFPHPLHHSPTPTSNSTCSLGEDGHIKHVIVLQFDNVHLSRDTPNVPSDIEQIPALYNFLKDQGTLLTNDHTALISHTADGITSTETGLYPGDEGLGVSNSFEYLSKKSPGTSNASAFTYWTDTTGSSSTGDTAYTMINQAGQNTSAPWVPFTRAGCNFAGVGAANMELENPTYDVSDVFGSSSPQYGLGNYSYNPAYYASSYWSTDPSSPNYSPTNHAFAAQASNIGATDFEGLAIHCSLAASAAGKLCGSQNGGEPDSLPDEPSGYVGYNALFGAVNVNPVLTGQPDQPLPSNVETGFNTAVTKTAAGSSTTPVLPAGNWWAPPVYDVFAPNATNSGPHSAPDPANADASTTPPPDKYVPGHTDTSQILDETGTPGFPGFNGMEANNALGYTAAAQEAGIPITYTYLSDVHDDEYYQNGGDAYGPGEAGHEAQLREYNAAFTAFFNRLAAHGINKSNTLFLVTVDEGDHFVGSTPTNPHCNGTTVACNYGAPNTASRDEGEIDVNLPGLMKTDYGITTPFGFDFDDAPAILVPNGTTQTPMAQDSSAVRDLEYDMSKTDVYEPTLKQNQPITVNLADQTEEGILHMLNGDPLRDPTFTLFGNDNFYFESSCDTGASSDPGCPEQNPGFAWNHGDIQPQISSTWQGWVGPGIAHDGQTGAVWTDHTDVRPTLLTLLGLHDDYATDGATIAQLLTPQATPWTIRANEGAYDKVESALKLVDAPFGQFGLDTLNADTNAASTDPGVSKDETFYQDMDAQLQTCESARQSLVSQIQTTLTNAENGVKPVSSYEANVLTSEANWLIGGATRLETSTANTLPTKNVCSV
jgi:hypothetical protein